MIPILYEHTETSFTTLGIGALAETTSCEVTEERNGKFELVLKYPVKGLLYSEIIKERIIRVKVGDKIGNIQAFRIYRISQPLNGTITVYAQHVSYDLSSLCVKPFNYVSKTPTEIVNSLLSRAIGTNRFSFYSDIANQLNFESLIPLSIRSALGGSNSLLSLIEGEYEWDNYQVKFLSARGNDNGVIIEYGKNLTKLEHNNDLSEIYTHLMPYAKYEDNGESHTITLTEGVLPIVTTLTEQKTLIMDFSDRFVEGVEKTEAQLRSFAQAYLADNPLGIEAPEITVSFEPLWQDKSFNALEERINLCDWVTVRYTDLGINAKSKVVKAVYNVLLEKYKSITLGSIKASLVDSIVSIEKEVKETEVVIRDIPSKIDEKIKNATDLITGTKGGCIVLKTDNVTGKPYELLIMDDPDITQAQNVWRWNLGGLGFSSNGYNGPYTTAITNDGNIVADFITTGVLTADIINAGVISSYDDSSYWNIETGDISITGAITATSGTFDNCVINDTCNIYGNLWMEGEIRVGDRYNGAAYDCDTRVGGDGIQSEVEVRSYNAYGHPTYTLKADSYITPLGTLFVPIGREGHYTDKWSDMAFGIANDFSFLPGHLMVGLAASLRQIDDPSYQTYDGYQLHLTARGDLIEVYYQSDYAERSYTYWGHYGTYNYFVNSFYFGGRDGGRLSSLSYDILDSKAYGYLKGKWLADDIYFGGRVDTSNYLGNITVSSTKFPHLAGTWYGDTLRFGSEYNQSYHSKIDSDQLTFYYASNEVGDIECYQSYVDIQGTWKTNGSNWISTSDAKVKNTIEELDERYSVLFSSLQPRSFKYNEGKSGRTHTGFIVQEVLEAMEKAGISNDEYGLCCAFGDKDNPETIWGLRYEEIIALCVKEIQRLNKRIKELEEMK